MQDGPVYPARFEVIIRIFRETACIEDAALLRYLGPAEGVCLASIVEAGPEEQTGDKWTFGTELDSFFNASPRSPAVELS